jgi:hypothetical protein
LGLREFDSLGDAIAHEFTARGPTDLLLLGLRLACSGRLLEAAASGLGVFAASAGVGVSAVPPTTTVATMPAHKAVAK